MRWNRHTPFLQHQMLYMFLEAICEAEKVTKARNCSLLDSSACSFSANAPCVSTKDPFDVVSQLPYCYWRLRVNTQ